ncbi:MAG: lysophospholipid acyltransferase family protein [Rhodospirillales bacterium]
MTAVRSFLFNGFFFVFHLALVVGMLVLLPLPRRWMQATVKLWTSRLRVGLQFILGLGFEVRGRENLPTGPCVFASKHQSAWDTFVFYLLVDDPNYVIKKELARFPVWGWHALKCGAIAVDRSGGAQALKRMVRDVEDRVARGRQVIIFPEGTRVAPGARRPYNPGIAAIYAHTKAPVIPVALNSGLFWGKRSFHKKPGVITVQFLPAMPEGLDRRRFMEELENRIETTTDALVAEAQARFPHLAADDANPG